MTRREIAAKVVSKLLSIVFCLALLYGTLRFMNWLFPLDWKAHVVIVAFLALDFALMISEIKPHGLLYWLWPK